jgi:BirA family transcriptional regulator, biotin operon repressor / biotin---[acetyl-CoA-carboxylase] ligase
MRMADGLLNEARLRAALGARPFRFEAQTGSTNDIARQWALAGAPPGSVVLTEEQSAGRGRFGRAWSALPGTALLMSMILRPRVSQEHLPRLTMVGAVSVADVLDDLAPGQVSLKWPNDVHLAGRKVAGILPEAIWQGEQLAAVILGIGLNVRVDFANTPLAERAISIETVTGTPVDRATLLDKLLRRIEHWSPYLGDSSLVEAWRARLETLGRRVTAMGAGDAISGQAVGVDENGALLLQSGDGAVHRVIAGEVTLSD